MKNRSMRVLVWLPRILTVLFAGFISLFALDVFDAGYGFWGTLQAFAIHMIPTAVIVVCLVLAWRWSWIGALAFTGMGAGYLVMAWGKEHWTAYAAISGPLFVIAILYLLNWLWRSKLEGGRGEAD